MTTFAHAEVHGPRHNWQFAVKKDLVMRRSVPGSAHAQMKQKSNRIMLKSKSFSVGALRSLSIGAVCFGLIGSSVCAEVIPTIEGTWPGYRRDSVQALAVRDHHAYLAGHDLSIVDVTDPANPRRLGGCEIPGGANAVAVSGDFAYTAGQAGLQVFDIANPAIPELVGRYDGSGWNVAIMGDYALLIGQQRLEVIDVRDPSALVRVGSYEFSPGISHVVVSGTFVYLALWGGLEIVSFSDPARPTRVGRYEQTGWKRGLGSSGDYIYLAAENQNHLEVIDVSNPALPTRVARHPSAGSIAAMVVSGGYCYLFASGHLELLDITDPAVPRPVGRWQEMAMQAHAMASLVISGRYAFALEMNGELYMFEISHSEGPLHIGWYRARGHAQSVALSGDYAYLADGPAGLHIMDIRDPRNLVRVGGPNGGYPVSGIGPRYDFWAHAVAISGNYAFVAAGRAGLKVIDISVPANPKEVAEVPHPLPQGGGIWSVAVAGRYAYAAGSIGGGMGYSKFVTVYDISNPSNPVAVGEYERFWSFVGFSIRLLNHEYEPLWDKVAVSGQYAYFLIQAAAISRNGLDIIDISDPSNPVLMGHYSEIGTAQCVEIYGNHVYLAYGEDGLHIVDVSAPANPRLVGSYKPEIPGPNGQVLRTSVRSVAVSGNRAYVTGIWIDEDARGAFLHVLDISDPAQPRRSGSCEKIGYGWRGLALKENYAFVAAGDWGLDVVRINSVEPLLHIARDGEAVSISWPAGDTAFRLETTPSLGLGAGWSEVAGVEKTENLFKVSAPLDTPNAFYRLRMQQNP
jgi:hypothetical protein